jgi:hypothetical protein
MATEDKDSVVLGGSKGNMLGSCEGLVFSDGVFFKPLAVSYIKYGERNSKML